MTMIPFTRINPWGGVCIEPSTRIQRLPSDSPFAIGSRALFTSITATVTASSTRATGEQQQQQQPSTAATTPGAAERSLLLPAVQSLKKIALVARKHVFAAGRKQSLQDECGRYEELSGRWQQQADEQMAAAAAR
jgi:hypothetical protein